LAEMVIDMTGSKSQFTYLPLPGDDPARRRPDIDLAKRHLRWTPTVALRDGLRLTIEYFDHVLSAGLPGARFEVARVVPSMPHLTS
jgi:UDP-glucuronate decarboxylase